jgi:hypothetical protein
MGLGRPSLFAARLTRRCRRLGVAALAVLLTLVIAGAGASLSISSASMSGDACQEEAGSQTEARLCSHHRSRLRVCHQQLHTAWVPPLVPVTHRHACQVATPPAPALLHLIGSGIRRLW